MSLNLNMQSRIVIQQFNNIAQLYYRLITKVCFICFKEEVSQSHVLSNSYFLKHNVFVYLFIFILLWKLKVLRVEKIAWIAYCDTIV